MIIHSEFEACFHKYAYSYNSKIVTIKKKVEVKKRQLSKVFEQFIEPDLKALMATETRSKSPDQATRLPWNFTKVTRPGFI